MADMLTQTQVWMSFRYAEIMAQEQAVLSLTTRLLSSGQLYSSVSVLGLVEVNRLKPHHSPLKVTTPYNKYPYY